MKKLLLILAFITGCMWTHSMFASTLEFSKCDGMNCFLAGVLDAGKNLGGMGVVTGVGISQAIQNFIVYLLSFLSLIALVYIMYAGAQLLLNPADEESAAKTKKIIIGVISGIVIIWFAWWIVSTIFYLVDSGSKKSSFIPRAIAETQVRNVDFTTFSNGIEALEVSINAGYSPEVINELEMLVEGAYDHLPDRTGLYGNKQRYDEVIKALGDYKRSPEGDKTISRGILQTAIKRFIDVQEERPDENSSFGVYKIVSHPDAEPDRGSAPHSVTFNAKETIDESGTVIPNENYIWWLRMGGDKNKIIGRGKIINYTFDSEGTYSVFLTVNSASKNSKGFTDTISFEGNVTVEVTQPEVDFVLKINNQIADKIVKISTKDALKPIRIDALETKFASGYTIKSTEWDFGNKNSDSNEGGPQMESQQYGPGEYTIRLKLVRNDGEEFSHNVVLKIGDPLASISAKNIRPNKGQKVVFEAKKTSSEPDVRYVWEVNKQGVNTILYTTTGTRLEYTFGDTGSYFVTLTAIKGDALDKEALEVIVDSRPPNVQFTSEKVSSQMPNVYVFDGSNSFDPDYPDNQKLKFEWFINDAPMELTETNERNSRGKYAFPEKGTYRITLRVTDDTKKTKEYTRDIAIVSTLSVQLNTRPEVTKRGEKVLLSVVAPRAKTYEWKVGANDPVRTENNRFMTSFATSGTFPVAVTVTDIDGNSNTASGVIYVAADNQPLSILNIKSDSTFTAGQQGICNGQEAVVVDRANAVVFSAERSINTDGRFNDMTYFWKIGLNKSSTQKNISYTFDELGCEEIVLTLSDKVTGSSHASRAWVKVVNIPPIFKDIDVAVENLDMDPMRVNLKILGAKDPDGVIRSYTWYYYTDKDDQPQGFRITRTPEVSFALPKITGRYYFAVMMEDSNGLKVNTKETSDILFSTPELYVNTNLSTPIIENFQANATEVKFGDETTLSLDVRTPVSSDVSDKSEYRWDIDGDGFYDVKTTVPLYVFKYIAPGEYNPKVKVTHKGISATKSLTITVKNSLVPRATIQMMGNKIVAYNTSSGVFQSTNWYMDNKKISENRDYLIYELDGTAPKNLKIEISDGKVTESAVYPVQMNLKNKALIKKITRGLVVLSPLSGTDVQETPDEIVWEDPLVPLFLYLGESRGDIRYYIIDTDTDIDTDLSGGRDDDADNKGTASYRSGRPFQIPKGTKRVTMMKLRIVGNNNQDLDTRQIRVTRTFLANTDIVSPDTTPETQTFNLSQEDKERIEKLRKLVQGASEEEKKEFNKILDQLGDTWYDVTDRIQTLNLFSNAVNASTNLSEELKKKILEQINIVYTQGNDDIEERQLALKMITEYLAKSPDKIKIFGDDTTEGLLSEIIDNPEYYESNLLVIKKIMDEYVDSDATLTQEVKNDIREKLMVLAGSPPVVVVPPVRDQQNSSSTSLLLWIFGGILCIILGIVGVIYARKKTAPHHDTTTPDIAVNSPTSASVSRGDQAPASSDSTSSTANTPDWLKEDASPFGDEDVFSTDTTAESSEAPQPDWLQDATPESSVPRVEDTGAHQESELPSTEATTDVSPEPHVGDVSNTDEVPDWLQGTPSGGDQFTGDNSIETSPTVNISGEASTTEPIPETSPFASIMNEDISSQAGDSSETGEGGVSEKTTPSEMTHNEDIPDWLQGAPVSDPVPQATEPRLTALGKETIDPVVPLPNLIRQSGESTEDTVGDVSQNDEDIPDWLRGAEVATEKTEGTDISEDESSEPQGIITDDTLILREEERTPLDTETSTRDISASVKEETSQNDGKNTKSETIEVTDEGLLESPKHLIESSQDSLIAPPKEKKPAKKKVTSRKKSKTVPSDHLLSSEHDMLLSPQSTDNHL